MEEVNSELEAPLLNNPPIPGCDGVGNGDDDLAPNNPAPEFKLPNNPPLELELPNNPDAPS